MLPQEDNVEVEAGSDARAAGIVVIEEKPPCFTEIEQRHHDRTIFQQSLATLGSGLPKLPREESVFDQIFGATFLTSWIWLPPPLT